MKNLVVLLTCSLFLINCTPTPCETTCGEVIDWAYVGECGNLYMTIQNECTGNLEEFPYTSEWFDDIIEDNFICIDNSQPW